MCAIHKAIVPGILGPRHPCTNDSSSPGAGRHLGHDAANAMQQGY